MGKLNGRTDTGMVMAFTRYRDSDGAFWNTATPGFEAYDVAHVAAYAIPAPEIGATGVYSAEDPAPSAAGIFEFVTLSGPTLTEFDLQENVLGTGRVDVLEPVSTEWIAADALSNEAVTKIADIFHRRVMADVEGSAYGDALSLHSIYGSVQQLQKFTASPTTLTVKKTDGTTLGTLTLTVSAGDSLITGVS